MEDFSVGVIGAGSWGTALSQHFGSSGIAVKLWGRSSAEVEKINKTRKNESYLPGINLSYKIHATSDLKEAVSDISLLVFAIPSSATREVAEEVKPLLQKGISIVSTAKGLETKTNKRVSEVLREVLGNEFPVSILSGPSFAIEVAKGLPTAVVLASKTNKNKRGKNEDDTEEYTAATHASRIFHRGTFRVYTSSDETGVELGGILKNIISFAAGVSDGLGLGHNSRAALLTRGLKEISSLVEKEGGKNSSVMGLSGLGDLILTATGDLSRNRRFGLLLGEGFEIEEAKKKIKQTIEAITTSEAAFSLAQKHNLDAPITEQVNSILKGETTPSRALQELLTRVQKEE